MGGDFEMKSGRSRLEGGVLAVARPISISRRRTPTRTLPPPAAQIVQHLVEGVDGSPRIAPVETGYRTFIALARDPEVRRSASARSSSDGAAVRQAAAAGVADSGGRLPHGERIQRLFGRHDISGVRAHVGGGAATASRAMGADAYATGNHVAFAQPPSLRTAAHEAAHVIHQRAGIALPGGLGRAGDMHERHADQVADRVVAGRSAEDLLDRYAEPGEPAAGMAVQLAINVDDVTGEMVGLSFTLRSAQGEVAAGETVVVKSWNGAAATATVTAMIKGKPKELVVPKVALDPQHTTADGVRRYDVGVPAQEAAVEKSTHKTDVARDAVADLKAKEGQFKKRHDEWEKELAAAEAELRNQEQLLADRQTTLSRMLVKQMMFNRFDSMIAKWVKFYNLSLHPKKPCDPNLVKSMLFRETRFGTSGAELNPPPYTDWSDPNIPFHSRFNVMMNIQSSGEQQMIMLKEMASDIFKKHHLDEFEKTQRPKEWNDTVIWGNPEFRAAVREMFQQRTARKNLMGSRDVDLQEDYEFWIRTGTRWLFFKYFAVGEASWEEAARAYNGVGAAAQKYRKDVTSRVGSTRPLAIGDR